MRLSGLRRREQGNDRRAPGGGSDDQVLERPRPPVTYIYVHCLSLSLEEGEQQLFSELEWIRSGTVLKGGVPLRLGEGLGLQ